MKTYVVTFKIETECSARELENWLADAIAENLETDEKYHQITATEVC